MKKYIYKTPKNNFPEWKGQTEGDFYIWHFQTTLKEFGWKNLNYVKKYPSNNIPTENFTKLKEIYKNIPVWDMSDVEIKTWNAKNIMNKNPEECIKMLEESLTKSPYHLSTLRALANYYHNKEKNKEKALEYYKQMELILTEEEINNYLNKLNESFIGN